MPNQITVKNEEKKSCRLCAFISDARGYGILVRPNDFRPSSVGNSSRERITELKFGDLTCRQTGSSIADSQLDIKFCDKFMRKKRGMTLEQQLEEKENNKVSNRLRRNWDKVIGLTVASIGVTIAAITLYVKLILHI